MIAINYHIFFKIVLINVLVTAEMGTNKIVEVVNQFKSKKFIALSNFQIFKGCIFACKVVVFHNIMTMHLSQNIWSVAKPDLTVNSLHQFGLNNTKYTKVAVFLTLTIY